MRRMPARDQCQSSPATSKRDPSFAVIAAARAPQRHSPAPTLIPSTSTLPDRHKQQRSICRRYRPKVFAFNIGNLATCPRQQHGALPGYRSLQRRQHRNRACHRGSIAQVQFAGATITIKPIRNVAFLLDFDQRNSAANRMHGSRRYVKEHRRCQGMRFHQIFDRARQCGGSKFGGTERTDRADPECRTQFGFENEPAFFLACRFAARALARRRDAAELTGVRW